MNRARALVLPATIAVSTALLLAACSVGGTTASAPSTNARSTTAASQPSSSAPAGTPQTPRSTSHSGAAPSASTKSPDTSQAQPDSGATSSSPSASGGPNPSPTQSSGSVAFHPTGQVVAGRRPLSAAVIDGGRISLLRMDPGQVSFRFIPGYQYPERSPLLPADKQASTWVPSMIAAFNGGFHLKDNEGGYYYAGTTVRPLRAGFASLVITKSGSMSIVDWGKGQTPGPDVAVVRQNLPMLIANGVNRTSPHDATYRWGVTDNRLPHSNRSALATMPDGSVVFAFGDNMTANELATQLVTIGAVNAMALDMNASWPTGFIYKHTGKVVRGYKINAGIYRPASTYLQPFKKDFIAVLAPGLTRTASAPDLPGQMLAPPTLGAGANPAPSGTH